MAVQPIRDKQTAICLLPALSAITPPRTFAASQARENFVKLVTERLSDIELDCTIRAMQSLQGAGVACLALATLFAVQCVAKDAGFFEDFSSGWDSRWVQSKDDKYNGKFAAESPKNLDDQALKVTGS